MDSQYCVGCGKRLPDAFLRDGDGIGQGTLLRAHERLVGLAAQGHVGKVCRAGVCRREVLERVGLLVARGLQRIDAGDRLGRLEHARRHHGGDAIGRIATIACDDLEARGEERAHLVADGIEIEVDDVAIVAQGNVDELGERHVETGK